MRKFNVTVNGKTYAVEVEEADGSESVSAQNAAPVVPTAKTEPVAVPAGGTPVVAPMKGTVLKLCVADGAKVKKGDKIVVLEAMKMENDIYASASGTAHFVVKQGAEVEANDKLAVID